jgi:tellurite resistance protein TehA-like permease
VPTLWIVLGPAGQSITASHSLGQQTPDGSVLRAAGVAYGVPVWGLAMAWLVVAAVVTARTAHRHLPFSLTWWSFTFPVGTLVTGTSSLAAATGATLWVVMAALLYAGLVAAWVVVAARTAHGAWTGQLLRAPAG